MPNEKLTPEILEVLVQKAIGQFIEYMGNIEDRGNVDKAMGYFDGFWTTVYALSLEMFGPVETKKLQEKIMLYHHKQTQHLTGNARYADSLKFYLGNNLSDDEYNLIIKKYEVAELEQRLVTAKTP